MCVDIECIHITFQQMYDFKLLMAKEFVYYISTQFSSDIMNDMNSRLNNNNNDNELSLYINFISFHFDLINKLGLICMYDLLCCNKNTFTFETSKNIYNTIQLLLINRNRNSSPSKKMTTEFKQNKKIIDMFKLSGVHKKNMMIL